MTKSITGLALPQSAPHPNLIELHTDPCLSLRRAVATMIGWALWVREQGQDPGFSSEHCSAAMSNIISSVSGVNVGLMVF